MMTQKDILLALSEKMDLPARKVRDVIDGLIEIISQELVENRTCRVHGLGTFRPVRYEKRIGRHPKTGSPIRIPLKMRIRFKPGVKLKKGAELATDLLKLEEMAKLMVSELLLYNSSDIDEGIHQNDLEKRLENKLKDARTNFLNRIPPGLQKTTEIFEKAWMKFIEKRKRALDAMK